jgi:hypothetical protein
MSVSAVSSAYVSAPTQAFQRPPEAAEGKSAKPDIDRRVEAARGGQAAKPPPPPAINMNGQEIGQIISVAA